MCSPEQTRRSYPFKAECGTEMPISPSFVMFLLLQVFAAVLHIASGQNCVDGNGVVQLPMQSYLTNNCMSVNVCVQGKIYSNPHACPQHSVCGTDDGEMACVCSNGYKWDDDKLFCIKVSALPRPTLGCVDAASGTWHAPQHAFYTDLSCRTIRKCLDGKMRTVSTEGCGKHRQCVLDNAGVPICACKSGFAEDEASGTCVNEQFPVKKDCVHIDGSIIEFNKAMIYDDCKTIVACLGDNKTHTERYECGENAYCGTEDGEMTCLCKPGFRWSDTGKFCLR